MARVPQQHEAAPPEIADMQAQPAEGSWEQIRGLIDAIQPGDAERLIIFLQAYPAFQDQILSEAQSVLGNSIVQTALHRLGMASHFKGPTPGTSAAETVKELDAPAPRADGKGTPPPESAAETMRELDASAPHAEGKGAAPAESAAETMKELDASSNARDLALVQVKGATTSIDLAALLKSYPQYRAELVEAAHAQLGDAEIKRAVQMADDPGATATEEKAPAPEPAEGPKPGDAPTQVPEPEKEPAWVGRARAWNDANYDLVEEFNVLTAFSCMSTALNDELALDPNLVAQWQKDNGVHPDGRVGPHTVATARALYKPKPASPDADPSVIEEEKNELE